MVSLVVWSVDNSPPLPRICRYNEPKTPPTPLTESPKMAKKRTKGVALGQDTLHEAPSASVFDSLTEYQKVAWKLIDQKAVTMLVGEAGTGKTHAAVAWAVNAVSKGQYEDIYLIRSPLEAGRARLGFLPGDAGIEGKMAPWVAPATGVMKKLKFEGKIKAIPPAFIQGITVDSVAIVDECQCLTFEEFEMVITRIGEKGKMILAGDPTQDTKRSNGMLPFIRIMETIASRRKDIGIYYFPEEANCRHPLVREFTAEFKKAKESQ